MRMKELFLLLDFSIAICIYSFFGSGLGPCWSVYGNRFSRIFDCNNCNNLVQKRKVERDESVNISESITKRSRVFGRKVSFLSNLIFYNPTNFPIFAVANLKTNFN